MRSSGKRRRSLQSQSPLPVIAFAVHTSANSPLYHLRTPQRVSSCNRCTPICCKMLIHTFRSHRTPLHLCPHDLKFLSTFLLSYFKNAPTSPYVCSQFLMDHIHPNQLGKFLYADMLIHAVKDAQRALKRAEDSGEQLPPLRLPPRPMTDKGNLVVSKACYMALQANMTHMMEVRPRRLSLATSLATYRLLVTSACL